MEKIYLFFIILLLIGCESNLVNGSKSVDISCPPISFSQEHQLYVDSLSNDIQFDNLSIKASINNSEFISKCKLKNDKFISKISTLFIVNSIDFLTVNFSLPYYIALIDKDKNLIEIQYFSEFGEIRKNVENNIFLETDIISNQTLIFENNLKNSAIIIGFVLDEKRNNLLN